MHWAPEDAPLLTLPRTNARPVALPGEPTHATGPPHIVRDNSGKELEGFRDDPIPYGVSRRAKVTPSSNQRVTPNTA